ncbi:MAG: aminotransferase class I/II-fold pyridoxal phosphate-dependent enzyme [Eubacterium sp.]|nr:aminotransferase class I/II-fold pyridoxal phosphate-dependent enzyme [Eubacterium sp.]
MYQHGGNVFFQKSCIDFSANINFLGIPDSVMSAARSGLTAAVHYPQEYNGTLSEHIAQWESVRPEHVFCGNGASEIIRTLAQVLRPKKALLPAPGFEEYTRSLAAVECGITYYYTKESAGFRIPLDDFCAHITQETDVVFLCNPNNPTAVLYDRAFLEAVLARCEDMHAVLILDECFLDFVEDAPQRTMRKEDASRSLFIIKAFTKIFAMPGIRLGYGLCTDAGLMENLRQAVQPWNVSTVAQRAGIACTKEAAFVRKTMQETAKERAWLLEKMEQAGIAGAHGEANFIFFKSRPGLHPFSIMRGIMLRDCSNFEGLTPGYYRVAVRSRQENKKLVEVLEQWQNQS